MIRKCHKSVLLLWQNKIDVERSNKKNHPTQFFFSKPRNVYPKAVKTKKIEPKKNVKRLKIILAPTVLDKF